MTTLAVLMSEFFSKTLKSTQEFSNQYRKKSIFSKLTAQIRSAVSCKITIFKNHGVLRSVQMAALLI